MFGFDLRSLALCRIGVGLVVCADVFMRWGDLQAHYGEHGILPRSLWVQLHPNSPALLCPLLASSSILLPILALLLMFVGGAALAAGWHTRWASLLAFATLISLQHRNPYILTGGDQELRLVLLLGVFLPWGERLTVDGRGTAPGWTCNAATVALKVQLLLLYLFAGLAKTGPGWNDGTAVLVSLSAPQYQTATAVWLLQQRAHWPGLLSFLSVATAVAEAVLPLFFFFPWTLGQSVAGLLLIGMHAAFGLCLDIDLFSWICMSVLLAFWPWQPLRAVPLERKSLGAGVSAFLSWLVLLALFSNLRALPESRQKVPPELRDLALLFGVDQRWAMFAPPPFEGGWHQMIGTTADGRRVDLWSEQPFSPLRPAWVRLSYPNTRWYLFSLKMLRRRDPADEPIHKAVAHYLCWNWEQHHPAFEERLRKVEIVFQRQKFEKVEFGPAEAVPVYSETFP